MHVLSLTYTVMPVPYCSLLLGIRCEVRSPYSKVSGYYLSGLGS